jgi:hypothetical protein
MARANERCIGPRRTIAAEHELQRERQCRTREALRRHGHRISREVIYFIVVDRFCDEDANNNAGQDPKLYDPEGKDWGKYWGGDLEGVIASSTTCGRWG